MLRQEIRSRTVIWLHLEERPTGVSKKFWRPWASGKIIEKISDIDWKIQLDGNFKKKIQIVHFDRLRRRYTEEDIPAAEPEVSSDSESDSICSQFE